MAQTWISLLSISQVQLNNLAFASDSGNIFGWFFGIALQPLPRWVVQVIGASLGMVGYGLQSLFLTNKHSSLPYWAIFLLSAMAGNSICLINCACYVATNQNFASSPQTTLGLSTSYSGLSANIYTTIVDVLTLGSTDPINKLKLYVILNSPVPVFVSLVCAPMLREIN